MKKEKTHDYSIHGDHSYSLIVKSNFIEKDEYNSKNCLNIYWVSDGPSNYDIFKFVKEEWSELSHLKIDFIYHDSHSGWLSDGELNDFQIITVFFK